MTVSAPRNGTLTDSLHLAVLSGGSSRERPVSLKSGEAVTRALRARGHQVRCIDPAETDTELCDWSDTDVAFIALHGEFGEDGQVQQILEDLRVPYTGSGPLASKLAFRKSSAKERFASRDVPTPSSVLVHQSDSSERLQEIAAGLGYPLVVKPDASGSSLGVTLVRHPDDLVSATSRCFAEGPFGLFERAIIGSEWTLGVLDDEPLPLICIRSPRNFYDYTAKYDDDATQYIFDAGLPPETMQAITDTGLRASGAIGTRGLARVDLMLDASGRPWVLEVNTVPGFTDHSLVPKAGERRGWDLGELCERAVVSCLGSCGSHHKTQDTPRRSGPPVLRATG